MIIVDGKKLAVDLLGSVAVTVRDMSSAPVLTILTCEPDKATETFVRLKRQKAKEVGIEMREVVVPKSATTADVLDLVNKLKSDCDALVVQLPFPEHFDTEMILAAVPSSHDADVLSGQEALTEILPPVVGAIDLIAKAYQVDWKDKEVVIVGRGRLVGAPAIGYVEGRGGKVTVVDKATKDIADITKQADIIISGAGDPGLLKAADLRPGVVVFDAGTSESAGKLAGDLSPEAAFVTSLFTPVPGGIGPLTVAILLQNVSQLALVHRKKH